MNISRERSNDISKAQKSLKEALTLLGLNNLELTTPNLRFLQNNEIGGYARVYYKQGIPYILFDERFRTAQTEAALVKEATKSGKNISFHGIIIHEWAHLTLTLVTGLQNQPATRLLDEGWAQLLEDLGTGTSTAEIKSTYRSFFAKYSDNYNRCLDFINPVTHEENLNAAEYHTGEMLLLWIHETYGLEKMIYLLAHSPYPEARFDDNSKDLVKANLPDNIQLLDEYNSILGNTETSETSTTDVRSQLKDWEGRQFVQALLTTTDLRSEQAVREAFTTWINS